MSPSWLRAGSAQRITTSFSAEDAHRCLSHAILSGTVQTARPSTCLKGHPGIGWMSPSVDRSLSGIAPLSWASAGLPGLSISVSSLSPPSQSSDDLVSAQQRSCIPCQALSGKRSGGSRGRRSNKSSVDLGLAGPRDRSRFAQRLLRAAGLGAGIGGGSFFVRS